MSDSKSFIEPFKSRLLEVFNSSSSGDDPYRNNPYLAREERKRKKADPAKDGDWEQESQHLFEDFLSLDEEKITNGLAKAKIRKAMDRKYAQSSRSEQLEYETRAVEDLLESSEIAPEITEKKLELLIEWRGDLSRLLKTRFPALVGWVDLLSRPAWVHLAQQGMPSRFILNLIILSWYRQHGQELYKHPGALLYLQLHIQHLNLGLKADDILQQIEKFTVDLRDFESLLSQTLHAMERHAELIESFQTLIQVRSAQARRYFLQILNQSWLDPDKRLARFHLDSRYRRIKYQISDVQRRLQNQQNIPIDDLVHLQKQWHAQKICLAALHLLNLVQINLPLSVDSIAQELKSLSLKIDAPEIRGLLENLNLIQLERWIQLSQSFETVSPDLGFVSDAVLEQNLLSALNGEDWVTLEKWALLKAWYSSHFRQQSIQSLQSQLESFLPVKLQ